MILVASHVATAEAQTYPIECGTDGVYPVGSKVRVRLEHTKMPLEIAEISVAGLLLLMSKCYMGNIKATIVGFVTY